MTEPVVFIEPHDSQLEIRTLLAIYAPRPESPYPVGITQLERFAQTDDWKLQYRGRWDIIATASFTYAGEGRRWNFRYLSRDGKQKIWVANDDDRLPYSFLYASTLVTRPPAVREESLH